jgi:hypothetical protein
MSWNPTAAGALVVALLAGPAGAQTPSQAPASPAPPNVAQPHPTPDPQAAAPLTLTGCLARSDSAAQPGANADRAGRGPAVEFVLKVAGKDGAAPVTYPVVAATDGVKLAPHVGHRIEITGAYRIATNQQAGLSNQGVSPSTPSGSTGMETLPRPGDGATEPTAVSRTLVAQPLFVSSVKMVSGRCQGPTE